MKQKKLVKSFGSLFFFVSRTKYVLHPLQHIVDKIETKCLNVMRGA